MKTLMSKSIVSVMLCCMTMALVVTACGDTSGYVSLREVKITFDPEYWSPEHGMYSSIFLTADWDGKHYMDQNYLSEKVIEIEVSNALTGERLDSLMEFFYVELPITVWPHVGIETCFKTPLPPGMYRFQFVLVLDDGRRLTAETDNIEIVAVSEQ